MDSEEFVKKLTQELKGIQGGGSEAVYGCHQPAERAAQMIDDRIRELVIRATSGQKV